MKGILFKPESIQAIIEGRKTQTRRVDELANKIATSYEWTWVHFNKRYNWWELKGRSEFSGLIEPFVIKPRYQVGETVYIKEAWMLFGLVSNNGAFIHYKLDKDKNGGERLLQRPMGKPLYPSLTWRSPMIMPEWAARYFIVVTDVRAERLQEIVPLGILKEGITINGVNPEADIRYRAALYDEFQKLWDSINAKGHWVRTSEGRLWSPPHPWESNPWVFVYGFKLIERGDNANS
jgi:hypothetical protein